MIGIYYFSSQPPYELRLSFPAIPLGCNWFPNGKLEVNMRPLGYAGNLKYKALLTGGLLHVNGRTERPVLASGLRDWVFLKRGI